jgi:hypothetical protein
VSKAALFEEAERLFVQEGLSLAEIGRRIDVTPVTMSRWKKQGDWDTRRARYLASERHFIDIMHQIKKHLAEKVLDDLQDPDADKNTIPQSIYALSRMMAAVKPYSAAELKKLEEEEKKELTPVERERIIKETIKDIYGIG